MILKLQLSSSQKPHDILQLMKIAAADANIAFPVVGLETETANHLFIVVAIEQLHIQTKPIHQFPSSFIRVREAEVS